MKPLIYQVLVLLLLLAILAVKIGAIFAPHSDYSNEFENIEEKLIKLEIELINQKWVIKDTIKSEFNHMDVYLELKK